MTTIATSPRLAICRDMSWEYYCAAPGIRQSLLKQYATEYDGCPALYYYESHNPTPWSLSKALLEGRAFHCRILERSRFERDFKVLTPAICEQIFQKACDSTEKSKAEYKKHARFTDWHETNGAKGFSNLAAYKAWAESDAREVITQDYATAMDGMHDAIMRNRDVMDELDGITGDDFEVSLFAPHEVKGCLSTEFHNLQLKGRVDVIGHGDALIDLKTARTTNPRRFAQSVAEYGYDIQAAWYLGLANANGLDKKRFGFLAQEKTAPFLNCIHWLPSEWLKWARIRYRKILSDIAESIRMNHWPGPDSGVLMPPGWLEKEIELVAA